MWLNDSSSARKGSAALPHPGPGAGRGACGGWGAGGAARPRTRRTRPPARWKGSGLLTTSHRTHHTQLIFDDLDEKRAAIHITYIAHHHTQHAPFTSHTSHIITRNTHTSHTQNARDKSEDESEEKKARDSWQIAGYLFCCSFSHAAHRVVHRPDQLIRLLPRDGPAHHTV